MSFDIHCNRYCAHTGVRHSSGSRCVKSNCKARLECKQSASAAGIHFNWATNDAANRLTSPLSSISRCVHDTNTLKTVQGFAKIYYSFFFYDFKKVKPEHSKVDVGVAVVGVEHDVNDPRTCQGKTLRRSQSHLRDAIERTAELDHFRPVGEAE